MIDASKKAIQILKASISKCEKASFFYCKISNKSITQQFACAAGENFEIASISIEKTPIFQKFGAAICLEYA